LQRELSGEHRVADHMWWITDLTEFRNDYPDWNVAYDVDEILREIHAANVAQWTPA
jgi:CDP-paratose 2-epimerase